MTDRTRPTRLVAARARRARGARASPPASRPKCVVLVHMLQRGPAGHPGAVPRHRPSLRRDLRLPRRDRGAVGPQPGHAARRRAASRACGSRTQGVLRHAQGGTALRRAGALRHAGSPACGASSRRAARNLQEVEPFSLPTGDGPAEGQPARALDDEGRVGLRARRTTFRCCRSTTAATPASAASPARRCRPTRRTSARAAGPARSWSAAFTCRRLTVTKASRGARVRRVPGATLHRLAGLPTAGTWPAAERAAWKLEAEPAGQPLTELLRELVQEQPDVGDQADGLRRTAVGELGHDRRVDVHAHHRHPGRQHVPDADPVQHRREHDHQADVRQRRRVAVLRLDDVGHRVDQRTIVANAAGEDEVDAGAHAFDHHAALQHAGVHRARGCRRRG